MDAALIALRQSLDGVRTVVGRIVSETSAALADPSVHRTHEVQSCGLVVLLCGYFEAFLKDVAKACARDIACCGIEFSALSEVLRLRHYEYGGRVLSEVARSTRNPNRSAVWGATSPEDVVRRLHSPLASGGTSFDLVWEAFGDTRANPNADAVKAILEAFDVTAPWPSMSKMAPKAEWSDSKMILQLNAFVLKRNQCAHTGAGAPNPGVSDIEGYIELLDVIGEAFVRVLKLHVDSFTPPARGRAPVAAAPTAPGSAGGVSATASSPGVLPCAPAQDSSPLDATNPEAPRLALSPPSVP